MIKKVIDFNRLHKQEYQKPTMKVVELQHRTHLLQISGPRTLTGPNTSGEGSEEEDWYDLE